MGLCVYAYVGNDPLNLSDPSGECYPACTVLAGTAIAEGAAYFSDPQHFTWQTAVVAAGVGATAGLILIAAVSFEAEGATAAAVNVGTNFVAGSAGAVTSQLANGQPVNVQQDLLLGVAAAVAPLLSGKAVIAGVGTGLSAAGEANLGALLSANSQGIAIPLSNAINNTFNSAPTNTAGASQTSSAPSK